MKNTEILNESSIVRISTNANSKQIEIEIKLTDGSHCLLHGNDVYDLLADELRLNNIIDEAIIYSEISSAESSSLISRVLTGSQDDYVRGTAPHVDDMIEKLRLKGAMALDLRPIYGARIIIIAKEFSISHEQPASETRIRPS